MNLRKQLFKRFDKFLKFVKSKQSSNPNRILKTTLGIVLIEMI